MKKIKSNSLSDVPGRSPRINHLNHYIVRAFILRAEKENCYGKYGDDQGSHRQ